MQFRKFVPILVVFVLSLAACSRAKPTVNTAQKGMPGESATSAAAMATNTPAAMMEAATEMMATTTPDAMMSQPQNMMDTATPDAMLNGSNGMMDTATPGAMMATPTVELSGTSMMAQAWFSATLTNVATQETFMLNDLRGKVILVEPMAQWCTTCLQQQKQVVKLHALMGMNSNFVSLSLDIDPNEDSAGLISYIAKNGFDWMFAVAPAQVSRQIGNLYGNQFLNPPSAPMFIIDRQGVVHLLPFGVKSAEDLQKAIEPYLMGMG